MRDNHDHRHNGAAAQEPAVCDEHERPGFEPRPVALQSVLREEWLLTTDEMRRAIEELDALAYGSSPAPGLMPPSQSACWSIRTPLATSWSLARSVSTSLSSRTRRTPIIWLSARSARATRVRSSIGRRTGKRVRRTGHDLSAPRAASATSSGSVWARRSTCGVHDSTANARHLILPRWPAETDGMAEKQLAALVTRDTLIGVTVPNVQQVA